MDQERNVADGDAKESPITVVTADGDHDFPSISRAARALAQARHGKKPDAADQPPESNGADEAPDQGRGQAAAAEPAGESSSASLRSATEDLSAEARRAKADVAPSDTEARGETESADPADPAAIEPPRSWTKEDKELFASLPRATQERLAERERSRESDFLRRQNEAVEQLKGLAAREQAAEQARRHYVDALPTVLQLIQAQHADEFADVKSQADVERMAKDDMPRYVKWSESQRQVGVALEQVKVAQESALREAQQKWFEFATRQDALFVEHVPEAADPEKAAKLRQSAEAVLKEIGFSEQELGELWTGQAPLRLRDHRMQRVVLDATRYREAQRKAKDAIAKPVPPVQRPGVSQPRGAAQDAKIQALTKQLEASGSLKDAAALIAARRKTVR